jgi:secernin
MGHSPVWCWGFEQGVNEHGVAIGNHATWSREALEPTLGLIGMDLVRLGLERGRDAREALEVIASLLESHGQGGSAFSNEGDDGYQNSFVIADGRSAWVLETTARSWAARSVDGAGLTNALTLGADWQIGSRDLERTALAEGYWMRKSRLDFKAAYSLEGWPSFLTERRQEASLARLDGLPLSLGDLKSWLRDHGSGEGPPEASRQVEDPDRYSVCMHADPTSMTTASIVMRLPEDLSAVEPWPVWISFATPCTGIFVPVYLEGVIPPELASAGKPASGFSGSDASVWCAMRALQEKATKNFTSALPIIQKRWVEVERQIEADRVEVEGEARSFHRAGASDRAAAALTQFMGTNARRVLETAEKLLEEI